MKKLEPNQRKIANIYETPFRPWDLESNVSIGESILQLNATKPDGIGFHIYKMAPGTTTIPHRHTGDEEYLLIEGDLTENDGTALKPGDVVWFKSGTEHCSSTVNGCTLAVYIEKVEERT
ncbi:MAG: putative cupin superfamily protein [Saprospiraceae bacterium]|jgi:uncharacterized cupin superfamily protein